MSYVPSHRRHASSGGHLAKNAIVVIALAVAFAGSVYAFRRMAAEKQASAPAKDDAPVAIAATAVNVPPATLSFSDAEGTGGRGQATRDAKDGKWHVAVSAVLPAIDRQTQTYEAWLVSRLPFDFLLLGEMTTDTAGNFVADWTGEEGKTYPTYAKVLITRQTKNDGTDPGVHVVEGMFKP